MQSVFLAVSLNYFSRTEAAAEAVERELTINTVLTLGALELFKKDFALKFYNKDSASYAHNNKGAFRAW